LTSLQPDLCWQVYNQIFVDKSTTRSLLTSLQPDLCWQVYNQICVGKSTTRSLLASLQPDLCWQVYNQIFVGKSTTRSLLASLQPDLCWQVYNQFIVYNCLLCLRWLNFATTSVHLYKFCILVMFKLALKFLKWLKLLSNFKIEGLDSLILVHFKFPKWTTCLDNIHGELFSAPLAIFLHKQIRQIKFRMKVYNKIGTYKK
jgi:hypothetical protein